MSAGSADEEHSGPLVSPESGIAWQSRMAMQIAALTERVAQLERALGEHLVPPAQRTGFSAAPAPQESSTAFAAVAPPPVPPSLQPALLQEPDVSSAPAPPAPTPALVPQRRASLEDRLGAQIFNWIGMAALLIGASWALKLAFEHGLIGPTGRVIVGLATGAGLILWSERFRRKALPAFSYSLKAVGSGVLYLSLWAAFQLYHLLPAAAAFAAMALVTTWIAFMAWSQSAQLLAAYALAGGLATPLLLSTGGDHEAFLFSYLLVIDLATVLLQRFKPWKGLLPAAFLATAVYFIGWYSTYFHHGDIAVWDAQSSETAIFALLFFAAFALVSVRGWNPHPAGAPAPRASILDAVLLPLANAAFLALTLYSVFQDSGLHSSLAWLMLALAALFLGLSRLQATTVAAAMQLAVATVLLTIAIPLKASGRTLTTAWLVEGLVLYWAATRFDQASADADRSDPASTGVLRALSAGGFVLGLSTLAFNSLWRSEPPPGTFFNANLGASLLAVVTLAAAAWLALYRARGRMRATPDWVAVLLPLCGIDFVALLLIGRELASISNSYAHPAFVSPAFATALIGLVLLGAAALAGYRLRALQSAPQRGLAVFAGGTLIAFNFFALLTGVREINALWQAGASAENSVQRSLAVSAFLMLYGAALLAAGFWRRSAFIRWQALVLLIFTILKVFLYDVSGLSQGYRVASFLGLGALLMTVSLAYQRDWLGLKAAAALSSAPPDSSAAQAPPPRV